MKPAFQDPLAGAQPQQAPVYTYRYGRGHVLAGVIYLGFVALGLYMLIRAVLNYLISPCSTAILLAFVLVWFAFLRLRPWPTRYIRCDEDGVERPLGREPSDIAVALRAGRPQSHGACALSPQGRLLMIGIRYYFVCLY